MHDSSPSRLCFESVVIDLESWELYRDGERIAVEPKVFDLIVLLARSAGRTVSKNEINDAVWQGRIVSESALSTAINAVRKAVGDDGKTQRIIKTVYGRGFRFEANAGLQSQPADRVALPDLIDVRYCTAPDGVRIAYSSTGHGPTLVRAASFLTHLEHDFTSVINRHWMSGFSEELTYVRYDQRGNGLSDWDARDLSLEKMVADLETVVDSMGLERFALLGSSQGASISIAYAHKHPERVSALIIYDGYAVSWGKSNDEELKRRRSLMVELIPVTWGQTNPAGRQAYTALFMPDGTPDQHAAFNRLQQITTTPENAYRIMRVFSKIDVRHLLTEITVPTLVFHRKNDAVVPFERGREIASAIPGARFLPLSGENHVVLEGEAAWPVFLRETVGFVKSNASGPAKRSPE